MKPEYTFSLSINSHKHDCINAPGIYYYDTGYGVCFLDRMWDFLKQSWEQEIQYHIQQHKWLEDPEYEPANKDEIEMKLIEIIITTDLHEFIHYFLSINNIENDCCNHRKNPDCWLCNFTAMLDVNLSKIDMVKPILKEHPELLAYQLYID